MKVMIGAAGLVIRLNAGIYNVVCTRGDANAVARSDVCRGRQPPRHSRHAAAKVTFRLVARAGGDAIADTQWNVANARRWQEGRRAADPCVMPGTYTVSAKNAGEVSSANSPCRRRRCAQVEELR
jgi:hypothetical protein